MSIQKKTVGATLATAAAALFITGAAMSAAPTGAQSADVKCMGINSCKGHGACKTASNDCKGMSECAGGPGGTDCSGMNECKGMGWSYTETEAECVEAGGEVKS